MEELGFEPLVTLRPGLAPLHHSCLSHRMVCIPAWCVRHSALCSRVLPLQSPPLILAERQHMRRAWVYSGPFRGRRLLDDMALSHLPAFVRGGHHDSWRKHKSHTHVRTHTHTPREKRRKTHRANKTVIESCNQAEPLAVSLCLTHCPASDGLSYLPERQQRMTRGVHRAPPFPPADCQARSGRIAVWGFGIHQGRSSCPFFLGSLGLSRFSAIICAAESSSEKGNEME